MPFLTTKGTKSARQGLVYFDDDGNLVAVRIPKLYNLRTDPYERAGITSKGYWDWYLCKGYMIMAAQAVVQPFLDSFKDFPPRQKAASFTIDQALRKMNESFNSGH
ncbi:MAG TPA: hypothetical protein VGM50_09735 [Gemmatimonadaceae bacterium]